MMKLERAISTVFLTLCASSAACFAKGFDQGADQLKEGTIEENAGKYHAAIKHYSKALSADPQNQRAYMRRAKCYIQLHQYKLALSDLANAGRIGPVDEKINIATHEIHKLLNDWQSAFDDANSAITLFPQDAKLYLMQAYDAYKLEQWQVVVADCTRALELIPPTDAQSSVEAYRLRILGYTSLGQTEKGNDDENRVKQLSTK